MRVKKCVDQFYYNRNSNNIFLYFLYTIYLTYIIYYNQNSNNIFFGMLASALRALDKKFKKENLSKNSAFNTSKF